MGTVGIDIRVGREQVVAARKEIELLSGGLRDAKEAGTFDIAPRGLLEMLTECKNIGASVGAIVEEMKRLQGLRFDTPDFSKIVDSVRQAQVLHRPAAPRQPSQQQQQPTGEPRRQSLQDRIGILRPPMADKPDSHYHSLIKTMQPFPKAEEAAAKETVTSRQPTGEPRRQSGEPSGLSSSEKEWRRIQGEPRSPLDLDPLKTKGDQYSQIMQDSRRLQNIGQQGELQGGKLNKRQLDEFKLLSERIGRNFIGWEQGITKAQAALAKLNTEQKQLENISTKDPGAWIASQSRIQEIEAEKKRLQNVIDINTRRDERVQGAKQRVQDTQSAANGYGTQNDQQGHSNALKKALGWTLAAAGGFSILGFLGQSRAKFQQSVGPEATLAARGIRGGRDAGIGLGIGPLEYAQLMESISQNAGMGGNRAAGAVRLSSAFARANGVDPNQVGSMYSTMYGATGNAALGGGTLLIMEKAVKDGMNKARMSELMGLVARNTNIAASAQHGAGASTEQAGTAAAFAAAVMSMKDSTSFKQFAKSDEFMNVAQNGLRSAGSAPGEIMTFQALGGFSGEMTWDKIFKMEKQKEGGFLSDPKALSSILSNLTGSQEAKSAQLMKMFPDWKLSTKGAMSIMDIDKSGLLTEAAKSGKNIDQLKGGSDSEKALAGKLEAEFAKLPGADKLQRSALRESVELQAGQKLDAIFGKFETGALKLADSLMDGNWKGSFNILDAAVKDLGGFGKVMAGVAGLYVAGGVMNMAGGAMSMGKGGIGALGMLSGPTGILAALGLGGIAAFETFKSGAEGANYLPPEKLNAITGKNATTSKFSNKWVPFQDSFQRASKESGIDVSMLYSIARAESGFNSRALSPKGAGGVMQLMPKTAAGLGVKNPFDAEQNIRGGAKYFKSLMDKYGGNQDKALAGYNMGPGNLDKWMKTHEFKVDDLPKETREYVRKVGNGAGVYGQGDQQATATGDNSTLLMIASLLRDVVAHTEKTARYAGAAPAVTARVLPVGNH